MPQPQDAAGHATGSQAIPVVEEQINVDTRTVATHAVRLRKRVDVEEVEVAVPLVREQVEVERVTVGRVVDEPAPARSEGDVTIVPVYEEVLVKRWLLREELHIRRVRSVEPGDTVHAVLRREHVDVVRTPLAAGASPSPSTASEPDPRP